MPCARLAVHLNNFQALSSSSILSYFKRVDKGKSWCNVCGVEILSTLEHDDYHFALNLNQSVSKEEQSDLAFAKLLQKEDDADFLNEGNKRKKTRLTDYFAKKVDS